MKKKIATVAVALSALIALPAMAKNPNSNNNCSLSNCNTEQCAPGQCSNPGQKQRQRPNPYAGIELTPEQKTSIDAIETARRQPTDSAARAQAREARQQQRQERAQARQDKRRDYLNQVKGVLTPDQYVIFLENIVMQQPAQGNHDRGHARMERGRRGDSHRQHAVNASQRQMQRDNRR